MLTQRGGLAQWTQHSGMQPRGFQLQGSRCDLPAQSVVLCRLCINFRNTKNPSVKNSHDDSVWQLEGEMERLNLQVLSLHLCDVSVR